MFLGVPYPKVCELVAKHNGWLIDQLAHFDTDKDYAAFQEEFAVWYEFFTTPRQQGEALH